MKHPFLVIVCPNKRTGCKSQRTQHATALEAEQEAARLRSLGWSAYAREKNDPARQRAIRVS